MSLIYPRSGLSAHPLNDSPEYKSTLKRAPPLTIMASGAETGLTSSLKCAGIADI